MTRSLIVIPTYNEIENLEKIVAAVRKAVPTTHILIVDDNSPDGTGVIADDLAKKDRHVHVLHRAEKSGLGRAYLAGFDWGLKGNYDPICSMDADFSHDPAYLAGLIDLANHKRAIVVGSRYVPGGAIVGWTWDRYLLSGGANFFARLLLGLKPKDVTAGYKAYPRKFLIQLDLKTIVSPGYAFQVEMLTRAARLGWPIVEIPITFRDRTTGQSKVSRHELVTSLKSLFNLVLQRRGFREAGKFGIVGAINLVVDLGLTNLLVIGYHLSPALAGYVGTGVALLNSFALNRRWTFRISGGHLPRQFFQFIIINGSGAALHAAIYTLLLHRTGIWYNWAKLLAILTASIWNFLGTKYWVFHAQRSSHRA